MKYLLSFLSLLFFSGCSTLNHYDTGGSVTKAALASTAIGAGTGALIGSFNIKR